MHIAVRIRYSCEASPVLIILDLQLVGLSTHPRRRGRRCAERDVSRRVVDTGAHSAIVHTRTRAVGSLGTLSPPFYPSWSSTVPVSHPYEFIPVGRRCYACRLSRTSLSFLVVDVVMSRVTALLDCFWLRAAPICAEPPRGPLHSSEIPRAACVGPIKPLLPHELTPSAGSLARLPAAASERPQPPHPSSSQPPLFTCPQPLARLPPTPTITSRRCYASKEEWRNA
ncbi:hypothetical protein B0H14DRAFT_250810 [Mycena olivaceomarginata]|nr:hypothetical protein B0H14DRAFT_250810 [Mycena olivaceomarginata]